MHPHGIALTLAALLAAPLTAMPDPAQARSCPCVKYRAVEKRIYKPRVTVHYVVNRVYPFYPYLRSSWRLYYGYPRTYYVARTYRRVVRAHPTVVVPVIAEQPIDK